MTIRTITEIGDKFFKGILKNAEIKKEEKEREENTSELLALIQEAKEDVMIARNNFNFATDEKLLEYRIFELKAAESRLGYFLKMAKDNNISNGIFTKNISEEGSACV